MAKPDAGGAKKIIDVTHADESVAEDSSKPIIVTNRPVIKDPMMTAPTAAELITKQTVAAAAVEASPKRSKGVKIEPLSAPPLPGDDEPVKKASNKLPDMPDLPVETTEEVKPAEPKPKKEEAEKPETAPEPKAEPAKEPPVEEKPAPEPAPPKEAEKPAEEAPVPQDEKASPEEPAGEPATGEKTEKSDADKKVTAEKAAEAEQAKQSEQVEKMVESRQYSLPINSVEKRRSKRFVALGIMLSVLLALIWLDIALDAGLIHINNIQPLTHFFST